MPVELHQRAIRCISDLGRYTTNNTCREAAEVIGCLIAALNSAQLQPRKPDVYEDLAKTLDADRKVEKSAVLGMGYQPEEDLRLIREQAAVYREMAPLLARLNVLSRRRNWLLGKNTLQSAVEELEALTRKQSN